MTDYVYINRYGQYARLCEPGHSTKQVVSVTTDINNASVISEHKKASLDCNARLRLNRDFTALPATEQRTVRLETGTPYPKPGEYVDVNPADLRRHVAEGAIWPGDPVVRAGAIQRLRDLLKDARRELGTAQWALNPDTGYQVHRGVLCKRLEELSDRITEELER